MHALLTMLQTRPFFWEKTVSKGPSIIDFSISTEVDLGQMPMVQEIADLLEADTYTVHFPKGSCGELMTLKNGELDGMKTTSILKDGTIIASAGLQKTKITAAVAQTLLNLRHFNVVATQVNQILKSVRKIEQYHYARSKAKLENIFVILRDISRRITEYSTNAPYQQFGLMQLASAKKEAGEFFQLQVIAFGEDAYDFRNKIRTTNVNEVLLSNLENFLRHPVFTALELLVVTELFEILITGQYTNSMLKAAKEHIKDRSDQIANDIEMISRLTCDEFAARQQEDQNQYQTHHWHIINEGKYQEAFRRISEFVGNAMTSTRLLDNLLTSKFGPSAVENLLVSTKQGIFVVQDDELSVAIPMVDSKEGP